MWRGLGKSEVEPHMMVSQLLGKHGNKHEIGPVVHPLVLSTYEETPCLLHLVHLLQHAPGLTISSNILNLFLFPILSSGPANPRFFF